MAFQSAVERSTSSDARNGTEAVPYSVADDARLAAAALHFFNCQCSSKKSAATIFPGVRAVGRRPQIDNRPIGQLRNLPGIVQIIVLAICEAAVEHDIALRIERIWAN